MPSVSKTFSAAAQVSLLCLLEPGQAADIELTGTFSATLVLERTTDGGSTWNPVLSTTSTVSSTRQTLPGSYRWRCSAYTSGTPIGTITEVADVLQEVKNRDGTTVFKITENGIETPLLTPASVVRTGQKRMFNGFAKAGTTAGWVVGAADDLGLLATCPASKTASTLVVPITGLKVGDTITGFHLVGQIESAGGAVTVDAALRKLTAAAADVTDALVGAGITQLAVTADTIMSSTNAGKTGLTEVVGADETFYLLITVTTAASTDIALQGVAVTVTEA